MSFGYKPTSGIPKKKVEPPLYFTYNSSRNATINVSMRSFVNYGRATVDYGDGNVVANNQINNSSWSKTSFRYTYPTRAVYEGSISQTSKINYISFSQSYGLESVTGNFPSTVTDMDSTFYDCRNLVNAPVIPNSVTSMSSTFRSCYRLVNAPEIPNSVTDMYYTFYNCCNLQGDVYIHSINVNNADSCFNACSNYAKNIYVPVSSTTYNSFYKAMGNSTYNASWNANLLTF